MWSIKSKWMIKTSYECNSIHGICYFSSYKYTNSNASFFFFFKFDLINISNLLIVIVLKLSPFVKELIVWEYLPLMLATISHLTPCIDDFFQFSINYSPLEFLLSRNTTPPAILNPTKSLQGFSKILKISKIPSKACFSNFFHMQFRIKNQTSCNKQNKNQSHAHKN